MCLLLLIWVIFGGSFFLAGYSILRLLHFDKHFPRSYDRAFVAVWLGIALLAPLFLALSIAVALKPAVALVACGIVVCLSLGYTTNRRAVLSCVREISLPAAVGTLLIALGVSAYASQFITLTDSGLYHLQAIRWLAEYGAVPGIALIHDRLGFTSSWFALTAPLDHDFLRGHAYASLGGFVLFMMVHALGVGLSRMAAGAAWRGDRFLVGAFALSVPPILFWRMGVSPSPDLPVIVLAIVVVWIYLQATEGPATEGVLDLRLLPLLLSIGAVTIKLSAAPLVVVTGLIYCFGGGPRFHRLILAVCLASLLVVPYLVVSTLTSGYPLFPSTLISIDLPWTLPVYAVQELERVIQEWARWNGRPTPPGGNGWNWLLPWIKEHVYYSLGLLLSFAAFLIAFRQSDRDAADKSTARFSAGQMDQRAMAVALAGLSFSLWKAPDLRFALGYLVLMPALLLASGLCRVSTRRSLPWRRQFAMPVFGLATIFGVVLHSYWVQLPSYAKLANAVQEGKLQTKASPDVNWWMPPKVLAFYWKGAGQKGATYTCEPLQYIVETDNNVVHFRPEPESAQQCWDAQLPCAPEKLTNVTLRNPSEGLAAGFILIVASQSVGDVNEVSY